jgi:short-subunit dehydrogenase
MGLAGSLRQELKENNIGVSVLCPPKVDTPMMDSESKHILRQTRLLKNVAGTLDAKTVTNTMIRGIERNKTIIIPGFMAKLVYLQYRYAPNLFLLINTLIIKWASNKKR